MPSLNRSFNSFRSAGTYTSVSPGAHLVTQLVDSDIYGGIKMPLVSTPVAIG